MSDTIETSSTEYRGWTIRTYETTYTRLAWGSDQSTTHVGTFATVQRPGNFTETRPAKAAGHKVRTADELTKKAQEFIDVAILDDEQRPTIQRKMASMDKSHKTPRSHDSRLDVLLRTTAAIGMSPPQVGDRAWVWGQGRWRSGMLTKITAKRAEVAYTTPSSNGRIYRPVRKHEDIWIGS